MSVQGLESRFIRVSKIFVIEKVLSVEDYQQPSGLIKK